MGDFEKEPTLIGKDRTATNQVPIITILMTAIALLAPVAIASYGYGFNVNISAILWSIYMDGYSTRFLFLDPFTLMMMIPFLMFRVASVYQITRYYQGKTTKGRARIAAVLGDAPFLFVYTMWLITMGIYGGLGLNLPSPIMMIVGLLLLWRLPMEDVTVPWESQEEPKSWWEEEQEEKIEPPADNQPW